MALRDYFYNKYPYTDFHELNLDWVIGFLKELNQEWDEFQILNKLHIAGEWSITKNYPKYAIVDNNGTGYLSLKPVPAGIDINNLDYWMPVGTYGSVIVDLNDRLNTVEGDVSTLQGDVSTLQGTVGTHTTQIATLTSRLDVNNMLKGQIVYIGDSYLAGWTPDGDVTSWGQHLKNAMNKPNDQIFAKGGAGFCNTVDGVNFRTLVDTAAASSAVDNDKVTLVLFGGGYNDVGYSAADLVIAAQDAANKVRTNFPNAVAICAYIAWDRNSGDKQTYQKLYVPARYASALKQTNIGFIENIYKCLQAKEALFASDNKHPNNEGQKAIANAIYSALTGTYAGVTTENGTVTGETNIYVSADENTYMVLFYGQKRFGVSIPNLRCDGATKVAELDLSSFGIAPGTQVFRTQLRGYIEGYIAGNARFADVTFDVQLTAAGKLEFYPWAINLTNDNYLTFDATGATNIYIYPGSILIPKIYT